MFYNSHIHIFTQEDVPRRFLPFGLIKLLARAPWFRFITGFMSRILPWSDRDVLDRYVRFLSVGHMHSQEAIFEYCAAYYPEETKFIILPMDMAYMKAGKVPRDYTYQLEKLSELAVRNRRVIPFCHVDPRRPGATALFKKAVEEDGFKGLKLYPTLGYYPYDQGLDDVWAFCDERRLPVITHCSPFNAVHYRGSRREIRKMLSGGRVEPPWRDKDTNVTKRLTTRKELCARFADPRGYEKILESYPNVKICAAHFGSDKQWDEYLHVHKSDLDNNWFLLIREMLEKYPNFYTDVSMTLHNPEFFPLLKVLLDDPGINRKILFGSDFYMTERLNAEREFGIGLRAYLGEEKFKQIAVSNVNDFLSIPQSH